MVAPVVIPIIDGVLNLGSKLIDKLILDPSEKAEAKYKLLELAQKGDLAELEAYVKLMSAQVDVNKAEAESDSIFKGGWRPGAGWVCVAGLFYQFLGQPLLAWASAIWLFEAPPVLNTGDLMTILLGMLGLGAYRSYEKINGVAAK